MTWYTTRAAVLLVCGIFACCAQQPAALAQQSSSSSSSSGSSGNAQQQAQPSDDNSFPADVSRKAAAQRKQAQQTPEKPSTGTSSPGTQPPDAPSQSDQTRPPAPGSDENAFPEDASKKAAAAAKANAATSSSESSSDAGGAGSGVSSSSDYDRRTTGRNSVPANVAMPHVDGKDPVKEDLNVGGYYLEAGNFAGAYLRFKDATTLAPENTDAIFGLAESARHLKRNDEALANYQLFLQAVSSGSKVKDARKAVASLEKAK